MQNLGDKLAKAGVQVDPRVKPSEQALLAELKGLARKHSKPVTDPDRLKRLPPEFDSLRSITGGEDFVKAFANLCRKHTTLINRDLVVVVCELAHAMRDQLIKDGKGGRQKRFSSTAIPMMLSLKNEMPHGGDVVGFVLNRLR